MAATNFTGISSNFDWRSMIDTLMTAEAKDKLDPITTAITKATGRIEGYSKFASLLSALQGKAQALGLGTPFRAATVALPVSPVSGAALATATADPGAIPGTYGVEILQLAQANKVGSAFQASSTAPLNLAGDFTVNGRRVAVALSDSLATVRDKINAVNAGTSASRVGAATVSSGTRTRLVLSAQDMGASGVELVDGADGVLHALGLLDNGALVENRGADGQTRSQAFLAGSTPVAGQLGLVAPGPTVVRVNGSAVTVDLGTDSLEAIAASIRGTGANASVVSETRGTQTRYRLVTDATLAADGADPVNGARVLTLLGTQAAGRRAVAQVRQQATGMTDAGAGGAAATAATKLVELTGAAGGPAAVGDVLTVGGTRADGSTFSQSLSVDANTTLGDLLSLANQASGFGVGARGSTLSVAGGKLTLTDAAGGSSLANVAITSNQAGGGALTIEPLGVTVEGIARDIVAGQNGRIRVDGTIVERATNAFPDVIPSVSLVAQRAEVGTVLNVTVSRDVGGAVKAVQDLASAYNSLVDFVQAQVRDTSATAPFGSNGNALRSSLRSITDTLLGGVPSLDGTAPYRDSVAVGVAVDKAGKLQVNASALSLALQDNPTAVEALFAMKGTPSVGTLEYVSATAATKAQAHTVNVTTAAALAEVVGAGFGGSYTGGATPDRMTIRDLATGRSGEVSLAAGDSLNAIVAKLNTLFATSTMGLTASARGGQLAIGAKEYGSGYGFQVSYTAGDADATATLGIAAGTYRGTDAQGTIDGKAALGVGRLLYGAAGSEAEGLVLSVAGGAQGALGSVAVTRGLGQLLADSANQLTAAGTGFISKQQDSLSTSVTALQKRRDATQKRLDKRKAQLIKQYSDMEMAITKIQQASARVSNQFSKLAGGSSS